MKLTEAKLKQLIKEVLGKGMKTASDLPKGVSITVATLKSGTIDVFYSDTETGNILSYEGESKPYGMIAMDMEPQLGDEYPCLEAFMVAYSDAGKGWGPLLYDVSMEVATILGGGLVSDRSIVSTDAYKVWDTYDSKKRDDVKKVQLDNEEDSFKNGTQDDCVQNIAFDYSQIKGVPWSETPVSKLYKKQPTTLKALGNKLRVVGFELKF